MMTAIRASDPFALRGKVAIVTGSSRGVGRYAALIMSRLGAKVVVSSRDAAACEIVVDEITAEGGEAFAQTCDISRKGDVEGLVSATLAKWRRIDILVCNAAINPKLGSLSTLPDEAFDKIMSSNVKSTIWLCNLVLPEMAKVGGGSVIIVSSVAGLQGTATIGAYGISKAAEMALARNLAVEWGPKNIRVNCVAPGLVKTDFSRALWEDKEAVAERNSRTPLRRIGQPDEIGSVVAFLASEGATLITGQVIVADGGVTIV